MIMNRCGLCKKNVFYFGGSGERDASTTMEDDSQEQENAVFIHSTFRTLQDWWKMRSAHRGEA